MVLRTPPCGIIATGDSTTPGGLGVQRGGGLATRLKGTRPGQQEVEEGGGHGRGGQEGQERAPAVDPEGKERVLGGLPKPSRGRSPGTRNRIGRRQSPPSDTSG